MHLMKLLCCRGLVTTIFLFSIGAALGDRAVIAQSGSSPTVTILRNTPVDGPLLQGDFNGDGIVDLAGSPAAWPFSGPRPIEVALGNDDGTFRAPIYTGFYGHVLDAGDFNGDRKLDLLVVDDPPPDNVVYALPGNGDGTFGSAQFLESVTRVHFGLVKDMDNDGKPDVVLADDSETLDREIIFVIHGNGDFTFAVETATVLTPGESPSDGIIADLDGDHRNDIVVANYDSQSLSVFLNKGSLTFTASDVVLDRRPTGVTAADINGDGKLDLITSMITGCAPGKCLDATFTAADGFAYTLTGKGDGTFNLPATYAVARGASGVAVADFTRDGILDIATGNASAVFVNDCNPGFRGWNTVSILPGQADGTFAAAQSFSQGLQSNLDDTRFRNGGAGVRSADVNRDGQPDLITSSGAIILNQPTDPNWPPTVNLGPDGVLNNVRSVTLHAVADDVDQDMLTYQWSSSDGISLPPVPNPCVSGLTNGAHTFTVVVDDGHGHQATDSITYTVTGEQPPTVQVTAPAAGSVVEQGSTLTITWTASDDTSIARFDVFMSVDNGSFFGISQCSGMPGTARQCQSRNTFLVTEQAVVRVTATDASGQQGSGDSGVFRIRAGDGGSLPAGWHTLDIGNVAAAGSASFDGSTFTVKGSGADIWGLSDEFRFAYQWVSGDVEITARVDSVQNVHAWTKAGVMIRETSSHNARHASFFATPGKGIAFQRRAEQFAESVNTSGPALTAPVWLKLTRRGDLVTAYYRKNTTDFWTKLGDQVLTGLTSMVAVGLAVTSHADGTLATATFSQVVVAPLPQWSTADIGTSGGGASSDGTVFAVTGKGADIWGTSDAFRYVYIPWNGDGTMTARIRSIQNTSVWAKGGVMFRESLSANAAHAFAMATPGKGVTMQYRSATGGISASALSSAGTAPGWLRLTRTGNMFTGAWSMDGVTWTSLGSVSITMGNAIWVGLPVTSHNASTAAQAVFDDVSIVK
jgi:hypothetical protein